MSDQSIVMIFDENSSTPRLAVAARQVQQEQAEDFLAQYARHAWDTEEDGPIPGDDAEVIERFYTGVGENGRFWTTARPFPMSA